MIDRKKWIGTVSEKRSVTIEKGQLKLFAKAVGESNPIYSDEEAAKAAGHPTLPAPPTFTFSLGLMAPAMKGSVTEMTPNVATGLHGEQGFIYHKPMYAGDTITLQTKTVDIYDKKDGKLEFVVQDTEARNSDGDLCVEARTVIVIRN